MIRKGSSKPPQKESVTIMDQPTEAYHNEQKFNEILINMNRDLWEIHKALQDTNLKGAIIPPILWKIYEVVKVAGQGKINITITKSADKFHMSLQGIPEPPQSDYHFETVIVEKK